MSATFFCEVALAATIEAAERSLIESCVRAAQARGAGPELFARPLAGGVAAFARPGSPINKVAGLGFSGLPEESLLEELEEAYRERGEAIRVELSSLADPAVAALLGARGYVLRGFENVLGMPLPARPPEEPEPRPDAEEIEVVPATAETEARWLRTLVAGFCAPDVEGAAADEPLSEEMMEEVLSDMLRSEGLRRHLALRRGGAIAGGASLRIEGEIAQLCGASTLPEHRRRGVQGALLRARLREAAEEGCSLAVIITAPGTPSQRNAHRQGFALLYTRAILTKE